MLPLQRHLRLCQQSVAAGFQAACRLVEPIIFRLLQRKPFDAAAVAAHGAAEHIVAVEHLHAATAKDAVFGVGVVEQIVVALEMIFGNIEYRGSGGIQAAGGFELEAGEFEYPHVGFFAAARHFGFQHRQADVAGHHGIQPAFAAQVADQAGYGGFAVAAGDGDHRIAALYKHLRQNFDIAEHAAAARFKSGDFRLPAADAGAERQRVETLVQRVFQAA